jgi:hypothetical protein
VDLDRWCRAQLGAGVSSVSWVREGTGVVSGVELDDGRSVVVKVHRRSYVPDEQLAAVADVQRRLAAVHAWVPTPLAGPAELDADHVATAEAMRADGMPAADVATMAATLRALVDAAGEPPADLWRLWSFESLWPPPHQPDIDLTVAGGEWIDRIAADARARLPSAVGRPLIVGHVDWRCEHVLVDPDSGDVTAVHDWDSLAAAPEEWIVGAASICFTVDFNDRDGRPARWPSASESAAFIAAYDDTSRLDAAAVRAAGDYHLAYIARCVHSVGGFPEVADLLRERTHTGT